MRRVLRLLPPVVPSVLLLLLFLLAPVAWSFYASFTDAALSGRAAKDPQWWVRTITSGCSATTPSLWPRGSR